MYTQCPECRTIFEIDEEALQVSLGIVHCGKCAKRFDALRSLSDSLPADPDATLGDADAAPAVLTLTNVATASGQGAAARAKRKREKDPPAAAEASPAASPIPANAPSVDPAVAPPKTDSEVDEMHDDLSAALIAAAAGVPRDAVAVDEDWLLSSTDPVQARFTELDIIPLSADELAAIESEHRAGATTRESAAADAGDPADAGGAAAEAADAPDNDPSQPSLAPSDNADSAVAADASMESDAEPEAPQDSQANSDELEPSAVMPESAVDTEIPAHLYVRPRARWYAHAGLWWTLGCLLLALTLAAQLAWNDRAALFRNPQTRPWVARVCSQLPCRLPLIRDVSALELISRDIRPDPATRGALVITATLRNNADFRQPWPIVVVELSDIDGNPVAMRRFRPAEYMPDPVRRAAGIAPAATAAVAFEVADPGKRAVNFQFGFE